MLSSAKKAASKKFCAATSGVAPQRQPITTKNASVAFPELHEALIFHIFITLGRTGRARLAASLAT
jgi:hypothetical protein